MFTMVNTYTLNKKQIQYNQELKEIETKEVQFVRPHTQAQRNRVPKRRTFR